MKHPDHRQDGAIRIEAGLAYNWYRHYGSTTGKYTTPDPLGAGIAGPSVYGYVSQKPLTWTDESGLSPFPVIDWRYNWMWPSDSLSYCPYNLNSPVFIKPPQDAYDPNGPKAPGKPGPDVGFKDPKGGDNWVANPNGRGYG